MSTLYLCGVGNAEGIRLALRVNEALSRWQRIVLLDDDTATHGMVKLGLPVSGAFDLLAQADARSDAVVNLVTRTTQGRERARERIAAFGVPFASLVHPGVDVFGAELDAGVTVYHAASIGAESRLGDASVVLVGGVVGHGAQVGAGCVIAPGAVVNARVRLGSQVYVGSNASILPDLQIGEGATIAGNTLVVDHVPAHATVLGVPGALLDVRAGARRRAEAGPLSLPPTAEGDGGELQRDLLEVFAAVLGHGAVAAQRNFFDAGGNSLKALQVCRLANERLGVTIEAIDLYRHPTVHDLVRHLRGSPPPDEAAHAGQRRAALRLERQRR